MKLAIQGGTKIRTKSFPQQITIGQEEKEAVMKVMDIGRLSHFRGCWNSNFYGGPEIQALEKEWAEKFNVKHAIAVNSATSGLIVACGSIGLSPGDEVVVSPWSMSCSATAPLWWNSIPIFADIEYDYYCLDPKSVEERITDRTKAIIVVDLFGQPYNPEIHAIAHKHGLLIIEDAAQAIGSYLEDHICRADAGTLGDLGVYSLTHGKHLTSGEGGVIVTNDNNLAFKCRLIRNHAEAVINDMEHHKEPDGGRYIYPLKNMLGMNARMTEIEAAIARCQLRKLDGFVEARQRNVKLLGDALRDIPAIKPSPIRGNCTHSYYVQAFKFDAEIAGVHRDKFIEAVKMELAPEEGRESEGVPIGTGYIRPLYLSPLFQNMLLYGGTVAPWNYVQPYWEAEGMYGKYKSNYAPGSCPVAERLWKDELFISRLHGLPLTEADVKDISDAFHKVWEYREELK